MEKIRWIDRVQNEVGVLNRVKEERDIRHGINRRQGRREEKRKKKT
jgi:hypothetical protein